MIQLSEHLLREFVSAAGFAPSGDNSRPWKFVIKDGMVFQYALLGKDNPALNYKHGGTLIANGAAIENILASAALHGYVGEVLYDPLPADPSCVARISFQQQETNALFTVEDIERRHTNRTRYQHTPLGQELISRLTSFSVDLPEVRLVVVEDPNAVAVLGRAGSKAEVVILETKELHTLLFESVKWTTAEEQAAKSGLFIETLELDPVAKFFFRQCRRWSLMNFLNAFHFAHFIANEDAKSYSSGGAYVGIVVSQTRSVDFLNAGRLAERAWLTLNKMGYAVHPIVAALFFGLRIKEGAVDGLTQKHIDLMVESYRAIEKVFQVGAQEHVVFMFRTGIAPQVSARSSKAPPEVTFE
jgi:hypothetical protein